MSTLGPDFVAAPTPTTAQLQAAFTAWFNALITGAPAQIPNPGATVAAPLTFAQIASLTTLAGAPALVYRALITQSGTAAPTVTVLQNTLGALPVWARSTTGIYSATLTGAFTLNKTFAFIGNTDLPGSYQFGAQTVDVNQVNFYSSLFVGATPAFARTDGLLAAAPLEIMVYP